MRSEEEIKQEIKTAMESAERYRNIKTATACRYFEGKRDALLWVLGEEG